MEKRYKRGKLASPDAKIQGCVSVRLSCSSCRSHTQGQSGFLQWRLHRWSQILEIQPRARGGQVLPGSRITNLRRMRPSFHWHAGHVSALGASAGRGAVRLLCWTLSERLWHTMESVKTHTWTLVEDSSHHRPAAPRSRLIRSTFSVLIVLVTFICFALGSSWEQLQIYFYPFCLLFFLFFPTIKCSQKKEINHSSKNQPAEQCKYNTTSCEELKG